MYIALGTAVSRAFFYAAHGTLVFMQHKYDSYVKRINIKSKLPVNAVRKLTRRRDLSWEWPP
jgi:hypothetical protein